MDPNTDTNLKTYQFTPPKPIDEFSKDSIKKIAVLFTDIVGSSQFFKNQGDVAGRRMLKQHQDMASPAISEHGGIVVKFLGDSVMSYFFDASKAVKAAIKIQQEFQSYNQKKDQKHQIHVRICIHFGDGIVEEKDIFGDVVNMAAKLLPLVKGDHIFISQEVYGQVQGLSPVPLVPVKTYGKRDSTNGLTIYGVIWDETISLDLSVKTLLYLKPLWGLSKDNFKKIWDGLLKEKNDLWVGEVEKEEILSDKAVALIVKEASSSLVFAKNVTDYLMLKLEEDNLPFLPIQIIIDSGSYFSAEELALENLKIDWDEIEPGEIYISAAAYNFVKDDGTFSLNPPFDINKPQSFYQLVLHEHKKSELLLFLYQSALIEGENRPCFYCGNKKHLTMNCPSKQLSEITSDIEKLGYLSFDEINNIFFNYLTGKTPKLEERVELGRETNKSFQLAYYCFYELKAVYQLSLFRTIWNSIEEHWHKIKEIKLAEDKGGLVWIGQDCIRVSNQYRAESILNDALKRDPNDYKAHCAMGFLNVERNNFVQAKFYFMNALDFAKTTPQKTCILFLMSRLYDLHNDPAKARERIKKIIQLDRFCHEATFQDIVFEFREGKDALALRHLTGFIRKNREYYINALIDPELANFSKIVQPKLKALFEEAQGEAKLVVQKAEEEIRDIKTLLGEEEKEVIEAQSLWLKIEELIRSDSYFGYLDIIQYCEYIMNIGSRYIEERRTKLLKIFGELKHRIDKYLIFVSNFPYRSLISIVNQELKFIQTKIDKIWEMFLSQFPGQSKEMFAMLEELAGELDQIELKLEKWDTKRQILQFTTRFFVKTLIFQSINLIIALILFPILAYYLNFILPELEIDPQSIWYYQKMVIVLGGISGLFGAIVMATKDMPRN